MKVAMTDKDQDYLKEIAEKYGFFDKLAKTSATNPYSNSMMIHLVDVALTALEQVVVLSLDYKLTAIVKLLQNWVKEKEQEFKNGQK